MLATNHFQVMRELATMHDRMNRLWGSFHDREPEDVTSRAGWMPPVDIHETDAREVVIKAEVPGLRREDIDVAVENSTLTIKGERHRGDTISDDRYHRAERAYGVFPGRSRFPPRSTADRSVPNIVTACSRSCFQYARKPGRARSRWKCTASSDTL